MHWVVGTWLITSFLGLGRGHNTLFEGYEQSLTGYHRCPVNESVLVTHVISYPTSYTQRRPCGGWLPWTMCDVTVYQTSYRTEFSNTTRQVMKCCHGYEQVGSYCALFLNRSAEFTSKPGLCPSGGVSGSLGNDANPSGSVCTWDIDCPGWQKCCQNENIIQCSDPLLTTNRGWCFNATITVKTTYELVLMDKGLFNHTRLLHSLVTGSLGTNGVSVHHLGSWPAGPFTTSSLLLVCSSVVLSLKNISRQLHHIGNIEEVTNVVVVDLDECANPQLNNCSNHANCSNTEGSYTCICHHGYQDDNTAQAGTVCIDYTPEITSILSYDVTNSTFNVTWTTNHQSGVSFNLVLLQGTTELTNLNTIDLHWMFTNLKPAVLYTLLVSPIACGNRGNPKEVKVRTGKYCCDGETIIATARLTSVTYEQYMSDPNSEDYKKFCESIIEEIGVSLSADMRELILSGLVTIQITSLTNGSVIVNISIIFLPNNNLDMLNVSTALMESLKNSSVYTVDKNSTHIDDLNECSLGMADCSLWAKCNNTFGSYTCYCWNGYTDSNPNRPGRSCAATPSTSPPQASSISTTPTVDLTTINPLPTSHSTTTTTTFIPPTTKTNGPSTNFTTQSTTHKSTASITTSDDPFSMQTTPGTKPIDVECGTGFISVIVNRGFLNNSYIPVSALYLGQSECVPNQVNSTHVHLVAAWDKCGTTLIQNSTHSTLNVTLHNEMNSVFLHSGMSMAPLIRLAVPIICTYSSSVVISTGYSSSGYFDLIKDNIYGSGYFQVNVRLLNGTFPLPENHTLSADEDIVVEVAVNTTIPQIKVIINKCWATPTKDSSQSISYLFLDNGCPRLNSHTTVIQNGNDTVALLSVRVFALANENIIYLHCQIQICVAIQDNTCSLICGLVKAYRSSSNLIGVTRASFGPLLRSNQITIDPTSSTIFTIGFVLLGIGVVLLALTAIGGLFYYKRKIGAYNFDVRPQQENFTYHVFDA
ncbi:uromodulin-like 1 [Triplophysa dalaica]|uniref:uromodulin-like 1 n=1 Tax=Triplophysa dalaica TaxID=1582913 RepID=UPI0024DF4EB8|nr:uromodulin-like 1 [Triplophysa dalaica]